MSRGKTLSPYSCIECDRSITWDECDERLCENCQNGDGDFDLDQEIESSFNKRNEDAIGEVSATRMAVSEYKKLKGY